MDVIVDVSKFEDDVNGSVHGSFDNDIDSSPSRQRGQDGVQQNVRRDTDDFVLCVTCNRKTVFKSDGTATEPARCIPNIDADDSAIEMRRVRRGEGLKPSEIVRYALCALCMSNTVYARDKAAESSGRGHAGMRRAGDRLDLRTSRGMEVRLFCPFVVLLSDHLQTPQGAVRRRVKGSSIADRPGALRGRVGERSSGHAVADAGDGTDSLYSETDVLFLR